MQRTNKYINGKRTSNCFKKHFHAVLLTVLFTLGSSVYADETTRVQINGLTDSEPFIVDMSNAEPIIVNDRTLVALRAVCEASGFKVGWDQNSQTVFIKLFADPNSEKPVEKYCHELMSVTPAAALGMTPEFIYLEMPVNNLKFAVKYSYTDFDGEDIIYGKTTETEIPATFGEYGTLMIPLRSVMESFLLNVGWNDTENLSSVSLPDTITEPDGMQMLSSDYSIPSDYTTKYADMVQNILNPPPPEAPRPDGLPEDAVLGNLIGNFKITHYCPCATCNGSSSGNTAWAGKIIPGQTIAVDPNVIGKLQWVYIEGYGLRRAEDCGGAIKGNKIDMAVVNHSTAMKMGVAYKNVYAVTFR